MVALRREACFLSRAASSLPLPVPRPELVEDSRCPPFSVHDEIVGDVLTRERWALMSPAAQHRSVVDLASFLKALHAIPAEVARGCGVESLSANEFAGDLRPLASGAIYPLLAAETSLRLDDALKRWAGEPAAAAECPLHCDLASGHLFFDPASGALCGVIDFGDIAIGDPARDFVHIADDFGEEILDEVLAAYAGNAAEALRPRIRQWSLLELVSWCVDLKAEERDAELAERLAAIERKVAESPH
jgi:aminoglycoside phosphotransferase (APT) family kinase protein